MRKTAEISECGAYRYHLTREWAEGPVATFIMLNPSTADANIDDPTIKRCIKFSQVWGCGALQVLNLFAARSASPKILLELPDPVGPRNHEFFDEKLRNVSGPVICAWGNNGTLRGQDRNALSWLAARNPLCLGLTNDGNPKHPLSRGKGFIPYDFKPVPYTYRALKSAMDQQK